MALLIIELDKRIGDATAWRDTFREQLPDLAIRFWPDAGEPSDFNTDAGAFAIIPKPRKPMRLCSGLTIGARRHSRLA